MFVINANLSTDQVRNALNGFPADYVTTLIADAMCDGKVRIARNYWLLYRTNGTFALSKRPY